MARERANYLCAFRQAKSIWGFRLLFVLGILLLLTGFTVADQSNEKPTCALDAYRNACKQCSFDASGKMNKSCYDRFQTEGIGCAATAHPKAGMMYAAQQCPAVDQCINILKSCKNSASSGNDSYDCGMLVVPTCFAEADVCMDRAEISCEEKVKQPNLCVLPTGLAILAGGGMAYAQRRRRKNN
ncbi:MAG: hypothetical protein V1728_01395 [Candidatus Micrarchaeota archaeon]